MLSLTTLLTQVAMQLDSNQGTAVAAAGAVARVTAPHPYDAIFPFIAFTLVVVIPSCLVLWVIYKTITEKSADADNNVVTAKETS